MKIDVLFEQNRMGSAIDAIAESMGAFNVNIRLSGAELNAVPGTLDYEVEGVPIETKRGSSVVPVAGTLSLKVDSEELAEKVYEKTNGKVDEIVNLTVVQPPSDFKYGSGISDYTVSVSYITTDGDNNSVELEFDNIGFNPSQEFIDHLRNLT